MHEFRDYFLSKKKPTLYFDSNAVKFGMHCNLFTYIITTQTKWVTTVDLCTNAIAESDLIFIMYIFFEICKEISMQNILLT